MRPPLRQLMEQRLATLENERTTWEKNWRDIGEQMLPYRFTMDYKGLTDRNKGEYEDSQIINNTPVRGNQTLAAGMMAGITSPARPWFNMGIADKELSDKKPVRVYLDQVERIINQVLQVSNWYDVLSNSVYLDLGSFATAAVLVEEDAKTGVHFTDLQIGTYWLDHNSKGEIDVLFRKLWWTTRQIVEKFGLKSVSQGVRREWEAGRFNKAWTIIHAIVPREEVQQESRLPQDMPFASLWWEQGEPIKDKFLRSSGYREFPVLTPRWSVSGTDVYGRGPGWTVRGDCKALQHKETRLAEMIDKLTRPPLFLQGRADKVSMLPGAVTHVAAGQEAKATPLVTIAPGAIAAMKDHIFRNEQMIERAMFVHLWQATLLDDRSGRATATEVEARRQEVMLMLGPLLQSLNNDLLEPCISRVFRILDRNNVLPPPPEELVDASIDVSFISILHQAQQATGAAGLRALMEEVARAGQLDPNVLDKMDMDATVDAFGNMFGVPAEVMRSKDEVEKLRSERAAAAQAKEEGDAMLQATEGVRNLGQSDPTSVKDLVSEISPVAAESGV